MAAKAGRRSVSSWTTQEWLGIKHVSGGAVEFVDDTVAIVFEVRPISFSTMSASEQERLLEAFDAFLRGLAFPVQIVVQSVALDMTDYFRFLADGYEKASILGREKLDGIGGWIKARVEGGGLRQVRVDRPYVVLFTGKHAPLEAEDPILARLGGIPLVGALVKRFYKRREAEEDETREMAEELSAQNLSEWADLLLQGLKGLGLDVRLLRDDELVEFLARQFGGGPGAPVPD